MLAVRSLMVIVVEAVELLLLIRNPNNELTDSMQHHIATDHILVSEEQLHSQLCEEWVLQAESSQVQHQLLQVQQLPLKQRRLLLLWCQLLLISSYVSAGTQGHMRLRSVGCFTLPGAQALDLLQHVPEQAVDLLIQAMHAIPQVVLAMRVIVLLPVAVVFLQHLIVGLESEAFDLLVGPVDGGQ